jgi:hypothetical protein
VYELYIFTTSLHYFLPWKNTLTPNYGLLYSST